MKMLQVLQPKPIDPSPQGRVSFTSGIATHTSGQPHHTQGCKMEQDYLHGLLGTARAWDVQGIRQGIRNLFLGASATNPSGCLMPLDQQDPGAGS